MHQLIRCKNCDELFMKTPSDQCPEYEFVRGGYPEDVRSVEKDDFQEFLIHHHGHQLENLKVVEDSFVSEKAYFEPVKTSFFKATNGKESFVVKKFRERIDDPVKYLMVAGDYSLKCSTVAVQSKEIAKQLKRDIQPPLPESKIEEFIRLYRAIVKDIDIEGLERIPEESDRPLEVYYRIDDMHLMYLLRNCHRLFQDREYSAIENFIQRHKDDGVLLLKATFQVQFTGIARPKEKRISASSHMKKKASEAKNK